MRELTHAGSVLHFHYLSNYLHTICQITNLSWSLFISWQGTNLFELVVQWLAW